MLDKQRVFNRLCLGIDFDRVSAIQSVPKSETDLNSERSWLKQNVTIERKNVRILIVLFSSVIKMSRGRKSFCVCIVLIILCLMPLVHRLDIFFN